MSELPEVDRRSPTFAIGAAISWLGILISKRTNSPIPVWIDQTTRATSRFLFQQFGHGHGFITARPNESIYNA